MPRASPFFGLHMRTTNDALRFKRQYLQRLVPRMVRGLPPSAAASTGLYGSDDFANKWKANLRKYTFATFFSRSKRRLNVQRRDLQSEALNCTVRNVRVTASGLYAIDDAGGLDNFVMRTPPQDLRSNMAEKMREVATWYETQPEARQWALPWKVFLRAKRRGDPLWAKFVHESKRAASEGTRERVNRRYSPYYMPKPTELHGIARQSFPADAAPHKVDAWWRETGDLAKALGKRVGEATAMDKKYVNHRDPQNYQTGMGKGGGGWAAQMRKNFMGKTYKHRYIRPY